MHQQEPSSVAISKRAAIGGRSSPWPAKVADLAGAVGRRTAMTLDVAPELPLPAGLPDDVAVLRAIVRRLLSVQRVLRSEIVVLQGGVRDAADRVAHYRRKSAKLRHAGGFGKCRIADELFSQAVHAITCAIHRKACFGWSKCKQHRLIASFTA